MRQCTCGRSQSYPYCDETHKKKRVKNMKYGILGYAGLACLQNK